MSASSSTGIQTLLSAEHKAQEIVQQARQYRSERLKASKTDALKEVEAYKKKKEGEFQSSSSQETQSDKSLETKAEKDAEGDISKLKSESAKNKSTVVDFLLKEITTPRYETTTEPDKDAI